MALDGGGSVHQLRVQTVNTIGMEVLVMRRIS